jgi:hypothetical protein
VYQIKKDYQKSNLYAKYCHEIIDAMAPDSILEAKIIQL